MKKKSRPSNPTVFSSVGDDTWTTLGDQLRQKYPELAKRFVQFQETDQVVGRLVDQVCELFPFDWQDRNKFYEGMILMIRGHNVAALGVFTDLLETEPEAYPAWYFLGYVCGSMGRPKEEVDNYRRALRIRSSLPQIHFDLACAYDAMDNEARAHQAMKEAVSSANDFAVLDHWLTFASDNLGRFLDIYGNEEKAQAEKTRWVSRAYLMVGDAYIEYGMNSVARTVFKNAIRIDAQCPEAHYELGSLHIKKLRNPKRAGKYLKDAEKFFGKKGNRTRAALAHQLIHPVESEEKPETAAEEWMREGLRLQKHGRYLRAVEAYKMAIKFYPDFADAYYNMGVAFGSLEDQGLDSLQSAVGAFKHSIRLNPEFIHAHIALGASYIRQEAYAEAVELLEGAILQAPEEPNLFYYLGTAYRMIQNHGDAIRVLERAVELGPDSVQAQFNLGLACMDGERFPEAATAFEHALRIKPDLADAHYLVGFLYCHKLDEQEQGQAHLKKSEKLYLKLKEFEKAERARSLILQTAE